MTGWCKAYIKDSSDMSELEDRSVQLIITGPSQISPTDSTRLNTCDNVELEEDLLNNFYEGYDRIWLGCNRVLRPDGVLLLNVGIAPDHFTANNPYVTPANFLVPSLIALRVLRIGNFQLQADFIISKSNLMKITENIYNNYEHYLMFTKSRSWKYNKQFPILPTSWIISGDIVVHDPIKTGIPTAAIEEVVAKCVELFSSEGDLILDPFAGTGTTGKVAVALNRNCVLYEINENCRKIIKEKMGNALIEGSI